ncbi:MAG: MCE family protein, partial [Rhodothermales bacterium]|nr:MCE family protein [Rhodothermales bacterium]
MKYSNEIKVGATIIVATIIFIMGVRYFEDLPLFSGTYNLKSEFDQAGGLIAGNVVRINGVVVGSVNAVYIHPETQRVRVEFHVDKDIPVPEGSTSQVSGFDALGVVRLDVHLGPNDSPRIPEGGTVPGVKSADLLGDLAGKAPDMVDKVDAVLETLNSVLGETGQLISSPDSDVRQTLVSVQSSARVLDEFLTTERSRLSQILQNVESFSSDMSRFSTENSDSLSALVGNLNRTM